jgi:hypothetical protein
MADPLALHLNNGFREQKHTQHESHLQLLLQRQRCSSGVLLLGRQIQASARRRHLRAVQPAVAAAAAAAAPPGVMRGG